MSNAKSVKEGRSAESKEKLDTKNNGVMEWNDADDTVISAGGLDTDRLESTLLEEDSIISNDRTLYTCSQVNTTLDPSLLKPMKLLLAKEHKSQPITNDAFKTPPNSPSCSMIPNPDQLSNSKRRKLCQMLDGKEDPEGASSRMTSTPAKDPFSIKYAQCIECNAKTCTDECEVKCNFCHRPVCNGCSSLPVQLMNSVDKSLLECYLYTCECCRSILTKGEQLQAAKATHSNDKLSSRLDKLTDQMSSLTTIMEKMESNQSSLIHMINSKADKNVVDDLAKDVTTLKATCVDNEGLSQAIRTLKSDIQKEGLGSNVSEGLVNRKLNELRADLEDEDRRKTNLVYMNLKESEDNEPAVRREYDEGLLFHYLTEVLGLTRPPQPKLVVRTLVGPNFDGPKPLKAIFRSEVDKQRCLDAYNEIKRVDLDKLEGVICFQDRTKKQSERLKKLKEELKERQDRGEMDIKIQGNRIVKEKKRSFRDKKSGKDAG